MNYFALAMANKIRYIISVLQIAKLAAGALAPEEIFVKKHSALSSQPRQGPWKIPDCGKLRKPPGMSELRGNLLISKQLGDRWVEWSKSLYLQQTTPGGGGSGMAVQTGGIPDRTDREHT
jgi:hypothetical protein